MHTYFFFPDFLKFWPLKNHKKFIGCPKIVKFGEMEDWNFVIVPAKFQLKTPPFAPRKPLMSTRKKYVFTSRRGLGSEYSLGGSPSLSIPWACWAPGCACGMAPRPLMHFIPQLVGGTRTCPAADFAAGRHGRARRRPGPHKLRMAEKCIVWVKSRNFRRG